MWFSSFNVLFFGFLQSVAGYSHLEHDICGNNTQELARGCTTQILGDNNANKNACHVEFYPANSKKCSDMNFSNKTYTSNIGGVSLRPYLLSKDKYVTRTTKSMDRAVLNITFSNIKWKTMKFRFQPVKQGFRENHCRDIILPNDVEINDRSVLYYDCYWPLMDKYNGFSHYLDFEATDGNKQMSRGRYYFNVPSANMLSPSVTEEKWQPFLYIEILTANVKLHIVPPQRNLNITGYFIKVIKEVDTSTHVEKKVELKNKTQEVIFEYSIMNEGPYYFTVVPLHAKCDGNGPLCQSVDSPKIITKTEVETLNICIASITALIVATLFAYYIALRFIRRYWCKDYSTVALDKELPAPTKVLVIYSPVNRLHAECVLSFVTYLRSEYGFEVMYDGDISITSHGDPFIWAHDAFKQASHIMYIVGPAEESNYYNNIYDKPIHAYQNVDKLLLALIRPDEVSHSPKDILNVFFEHSDAELPIETRHKKSFHLLKDWQKLIAYLSKNLLPKKQIMRTERGRCFLEDLSRAKKLLNSTKDSVDVAIKCEKMNLCDKKVLI